MTTAIDQAELIADLKEQIASLSSHLVQTNQVLANAHRDMNEGWEVANDRENKLRNMTAERDTLQSLENNRRAADERWRQHCEDCGSMLLSGAHMSVDLTQPGETVEADIEIEAAEYKIGDATVLPIQFDFEGPQRSAIVARLDKVWLYKDRWPTATYTLVSAGIIGINT